MRYSPGQILTACEMSFKGMSNAEIAKHFKVSDSTVSRWRKRQIWIDFENELIAAHKAAVFDKQPSYSAEADSPAQG